MALGMVANNAIAAKIMKCPSASSIASQGINQLKKGYWDGGKETWIGLTKSNYDTKQAWSFFLTSFEGNDGSNDEATAKVKADQQLTTLVKTYGPITTDDNKTVCMYSTPSDEGKASGIALNPPQDFPSSI